MNKFIEVTVEQDKVIIDSANISAIRQTQDGITIYFKHGNLLFLIVDESYDEIKKLISDAIK